jgi:hypothetical protein
MGQDRRKPSLASRVCSASAAPLEEVNEAFDDVLHARNTAPA